MNESVRMTKETLGCLIQKPRMTDKLLARPPFRFLHDIVMEVIRQTGFPKETFDECEMDSSYFSVCILDKA